jgi:hypothetical protein
MENLSVSNHAERETTSTRKTGFSPSIIKVIAEGGENFFLYLKRHNISREADMLVLPSAHHYYYDEKELENVRTLVNLKKLNQVKHLESFMQNLFQMLPQDANFIGCFSNDKTQKQYGIAYYKPSRLLKRLINFIDSKTDRILDKSNVAEALERNGHMIVDMTEMDGITYFYSQNIHKKAELKIA